MLKPGVTSIPTALHVKSALGWRLCILTICSMPRPWLNAKYKEAEGALVGELRRLSANIAGNREFLSAVKKTTSVWPTRLKNIMQG
jgi:hypothetical protein